MRTRRLTMAQALIGFLKNQHVERDGNENPFFAGAWGIFGHGNVAGLGQALQENPDFRYYLSRNEQASVHISTAYAKARNRLATFDERFRRRAIDWAIVGAAVSVRRSNGSIGSASVVLTNVGLRPTRATAVESALKGQQASAEAIRQAADRADEGLNPTGELYATADYKRHLARVMTRRALTAALGLS